MLRKGRLELAKSYEKEVKRCGADGLLRIVVHSRLAFVD